jgi:hypothetical protein
MNNNIKCASCKVIMIENLQSGKILNKITSVKLCEKHRLGND